MGARRKEREGSELAGKLGVMADFHRELEEEMVPSLHCEIYEHRRERAGGTTLNLANRLA